MARDSRRKGTQCGPCVLKARTKHVPKCKKCAATIGRRAEAATGMCRDCNFAVRALPKLTCEECGVPIHNRKGRKTRLCRTHAAKSETRVERLRASMAVLHADQDYQRRRGRAISAQKLADIPLAWRQMYRDLLRSTGMKSRDRKRIVLDAAAAAARQHNKKFNQE